MSLQDPSSAHQTDRAAAPRVWVVSAYRAGEQTQILALAEALGWPYEVKTLSYRITDWLPGLLRRTSLTGINRSCSSNLEPPWPDIVISAGMRNEPIVRWIRAQSGDRTRLVHIGRPWASVDAFDLLITTPQYRLPAHQNILHNLGTLNPVNDKSLSTAAERWKETLQGYARPITAVVLGGDSGPYTFGPKAARRLAQHVSRVARDQGGSIAVTTSARTPPAAISAFTEETDCPCFLYRWRSGDEQNNPYLGLLALSDSIVVTGDSVSMMSEAVATGKPVFLFDPARPLRETAADAGISGDKRLTASLYRFLMRFGHPRLTRDVGIIHQKLVDSGRAAWLGQAAPARRNPESGDLKRAVERSRALVGSAVDGGCA